MHLTLGGESLNHQSTTDAFLRGLDVRRRGDRYEVRLADHVRISMPIGIMEPFVVDLLSLLDREQQVGILKVMEERFL